ncbi:hypothetical protein R1flu_012388 [Riccia fluitans]|uniref:Uncharacterized protein n=1 Tax=Riccia fluitans TaxID=41844 RepID=A0ABD1ZAK6_9MARC
MEDRVNLCPCLIHVPTGEIVKSYLQLSGIVKELGWKVFINVSENVWGAWFLPAGLGVQPCYVKVVFLPHPDISKAPSYQLCTVVQAFGRDTFQISYAPLAELRQLDDLSVVLKLVLRLKANGREVLTVRDFAEILAQHGWRKNAGNQFVKQDMSEKNPMNLLTVIQIPAVESTQQLATSDLEYITMVTETIFYLQSPIRSQPSRYVKRFL